MHFSQTPEFAAAAERYAVALKELSALIPEPPASLKARVKQLQDGDEFKAFQRTLAAVIQHGVDTLCNEKTGPAADADAAYRLVSIEVMNANAVFQLWARLQLGHPATGAEVFSAMAYTVMAGNAVDLRGLKDDLSARRRMGRQG